VQKIIIIALVVATSTAGMSYGFINSGCTEWCFDLVKNAVTKGFDPNFLAQDVVKQTCKESHIDLQRVGMSDLGFCSKELGTL